MSDEATRTSAVRWLSDRVRVILAPNPSPMTLEGTNTYLIGDDPLVIMDPGPDLDDHLASIEAVVAGAAVETILITHKHIDHAEVAERCAALFDSPIASNGRPGDSHIGEGDRIGDLLAVATPGHSSDHLCFVLERDKTLFSGDHILGRGTTVVAHPDGDMGAYMASLERLRDLDLQRIFPGHGPVVTEPQAVIEEYIEHRLMRERQVVDGLEAAAEPVTPEELVARIYYDVDPVLHPIAAMSVRAHLAKLAREGRAVQDGERWRPS
ncbi:MAG TPA: MBL fold metallo-hydrolase [Actinomycetota bacterium]|nr:MBL fold metallo-hydrolase [Actinomycetota bacterium]